MNVQAIRSKLNEMKRDIKSIWQKARTDVQNKKKSNDQSRVMTPDEKLDETINESFPASDSPGHFSKSAEDKELH